MTNIKVDSRTEFTQIALDNGKVRAIVLPELGGKMISLVRHNGGRDFLTSFQIEGTCFRKPSYGGIFVEYNNVGFDECMPTIAACTYPRNAYRGRQLPDHGDVWSLPWQYDVHDEKLSLHVEGRSLPYGLSKHISIEGQELILEYELENKGSDAFDYLWSSHPLLNTEPGARILLPPDVEVLLIDSSEGGRLGRPGESCTWPIARRADGSSDDLAVMKSRRHGSDKLYTPRLHDGYCGLHYPSTNESIFFQFDVQSVPYVGMWISHGGSGPPDPKQPYTVALEPCTGRPDSLVEAIARGESTSLLPHAMNKWTLRVGLLEDSPKLQ
jgi:galactose mutarotase-like enzyme